VKNCDLLKGMITNPSQRRLPGHSHSGSLISRVIYRREVGAQSDLLKEFFDAIRTPKTSQMKKED